MKHSLMMAIAGVMGVAVVAGAQVESDNQPDWYVAPGAGLLLFEGDQEVENGYQLNVDRGHGAAGSQPG